MVSGVVPLMRTRLETVRVRGAIRYPTRWILLVVRGRQELGVRVSAWWDSAWGVVPLRIGVGTVGATFRGGRVRMVRVRILGTGLGGTLGVLSIPRFGGVTRWRILVLLVHRIESAVGTFLLGFRISAVAVAVAGRGSGGGDLLLVE